MTKKPELIIIAAVSENGVIGNDGAIPWHYSEDFKRFKELTQGNAVIMGRKTWESLPKRPLPLRHNVVVTRNPTYVAEGATLASSLPQAIESCSSYNKVFLIGGASIYKEGLSLADTLELTRVHRVVEGDTYFPKINDAKWEKISHIDKGEFSFQTHKRK